MNQYLEFFLYFYMYLLGGLTSYILWGKDSEIKRNLIDGMTLRVLWGRFVKRKVK